MVAAECVNIEYCTVSGANAIYQNTIYGVAARLPSVYSGTIVLGNVSC